LKLQRFILSGSTSPIYCDCSTECIRPYVPQLLRRRIFDTVHRLAHPSGKSTCKAIQQKFVWPSLRKDIKEWCRSCLSCQRAKIQRHTKNLPLKIDVPDQRFQHVHLDLIGPLPPCKQFRYCSTMIDRFSRWPEAIPLCEISAETVTTAFYIHWISRFGAPHTITTDQGPQFEAALFKALTNLIGCKRIRTSAYHPAANGILERWHRTLKSAIMCHKTNNWVEILPTVLLGLRTCFKEDLNSSPVVMLYGSTLRIPGEFFFEEDPPADPNIFLEKHRIAMRSIKSRPTAHHCNKTPFFHKNLFDCTHVWVRDDSVHKALQPPYSGPFRVVNRINDNLFTIEIAGKSVNISTERLKPAFLPKEQTCNHPLQTPVSSSTPSVCKIPLKTYPGKKKVHFATFAVARGGVFWQSPSLLLHSR